MGVATDLRLIAWDQVAAIGVPTPRRDSEPKVRGTTRYAADLPVQGLLHARLLLAHEAHALIKSIDTTAARELPGVVAVLTADDLPIVATGPGRAKQPLAREEIVYAGQPVAIAVAETEALAADAIELIDVELEPLDAVVDLEAAARPGAPRARIHVAAQGEGSDISDAHAAVAAGGIGEEEELSDNVLGTARLANGDVDAALAASEVVVRARFQTPWVYQGYLEPQTATAWFDVDGELVVSTSTQGPFPTRSELMDLFGLPADRLRVRGTPLGGGFGGKMMIVEPLVVGAALVLRRPVRLEMTRSEDFAAANPAGARDPRRRARRRPRRAADRHSRPRARRPRVHRRLRSRVDRGDAHRRPLPLAGARADRARHRHQPCDVRRLPRSRGAPGGVRGRVADRRAGRAARDRPARAAAAQRRGRRRQGGLRTGVQGVRRPRVPRASGRTSAVDRARLAAGRTRASASRSGGGRAATSRRPRCAGSIPTGV